MSDGPCRACNGTGQVETALGEPRPCSRCNGDAYRDWAKGYFKPGGVNG